MNVSEPLIGTAIDTRMDWTHVSVSCAVEPARVGDEIPVGDGIAERGAVSTVSQQAISGDRREGGELHMRTASLHVFKSSCTA